jgi:hypothetical protein
VDFPWRLASPRTVAVEEGVFILSSFPENLPRSPPLRAGLPGEPQPEMLVDRASHMAGVRERTDVEAGEVSGEEKEGIEAHQDRTDLRGGRIRCGTGARWWNLFPHGYLGAGRTGLRTVLVRECTDVRK